MHPQIYINALFLCLLNAFFMVAGVCLNSVVIFSLWRSTQLRKKLCYFTIFVLSCIDLTAVTIVHPVVIFSAIFWSKKSYSAEIEMTRTYISILLGGFSIFALLTLSLERFLTLTFPFFHQSRITRSRLSLFQVFLMIILVSLSPLIYLDGESFLNRLVTAFVVIYFCVFIYLNYKMFAIAKSKQRENRSTHVDGVARTNHQKGKRRKLTFKNISTCCLTVSCFFICSFPPAVYTASRFASKTPSYDRHNYLAYSHMDQHNCLHELNDKLLDIFLAKFYFASWRNQTVKRFWNGRS